MNEFWKWLRNFANNKVMEHHMAKYKHSRLCPNCNLWTSETGGAKEYYSEISDSMYSYMRCNQCGYLSKWLELGMGAKCVSKKDDLKQ